MMQNSSAKPAYRWEIGGPIPFQMLIQIALVDLEIYRKLIMFREIAEYMRRYPELKLKFARIVKTDNLVIHYLGNCIHRENGPAIIDRARRIIYFVRANKLHRDGKPAILSDTLGITMFAQDGLLHSPTIGEITLPAISVDKDNEKAFAAYYTNGALDSKWVDDNKYAIMNPRGLPYMLYNFTAQVKPNVIFGPRGLLPHDFVPMIGDAVRKEYSTALGRTFTTYGVYTFFTDRIKTASFANGLYHDGTFPAIQYINGGWDKYIYGVKTTDDNVPSSHRPGHYSIWHKCGILWRENDLPSFMTPKEMRWHKAGELHRNGDKPAVVVNGGKTEYWVNGKRHRDCAPAVIYANGGVEYWKNGKRHREDSPAVICHNGRIEYYQNGLRHREDGPALITAEGEKEYWINGKRKYPPALNIGQKR